MAHVPYHAVTHQCTTLVSPCSVANARFTIGRMMNIILKALLLVVLIPLLAACDSADKPTLSLYLAVQRGDIDQIHRHIRWHTDINQFDVDGRQPLHVAAEQGEQVIVRLLLENGADIDGLDREGHSPLHIAVMGGKTQVAEFLIKKGASYDANRLLFAAVENHVSDRDVFRLLTSLGADVNHLDTAGHTPLIQAIYADDRVLVKYLITQGGADPNRRDNTGKSPLALATERDDADIIRLLKRHGAKLDP